MSPPMSRQSTQEAGDQAGGSADSEPLGLEPYSCLSCRKKRKKCDRVYPCANCRKSGAECIFAARKPSTRQHPGPGALERVKYLEGVVQQLRKQLEVTSSTEQSRDDDDSFDSDIEAADLREEFGQLAVKDGRSRYIVSNFWANLTEKVDGLANMLDDLADDRPPGEQRASENDADILPRTSILGLSSHYADLRQLHPSPDKMLLLWRVYKENCDPVIKILHIPTMEPLILRCQQQIGNLPAGMETLLFAIYFSAVASLSDDDCLATFGANKNNLIETYKTGMEQALSRARLLETNEFIVLQAFAIFLSSLRNHCNLRLMWSLTNIAVRLAQNAGLHRDGTHFHLSPFVTEMRRRLWWNICALDVRAAEDSGYHTSIRAASYNTRVPLNVNDADLSPNMTDFPASRDGCTEMTFSMVRFQGAIVFQALQNSSPGTLGQCGKLHTTKCLGDRTLLISEYQDMLQKIFLGHDPSDPFYWYTALVSRILLSKMWLIAYYPVLRLQTCSGISEQTKESLFIRSITIVESQVLLYTGKPTAKWSWFCFSHVQWYAIAYILTELCVNTEGELVERGWKAVNSVLNVGYFTQPPSVTSATDTKTEDLEFSHCSPFGDLDGFEYELLNTLLRKARSARQLQQQQVLPVPLVPHPIPGAQDFVTAAHWLDNEVASGAGGLNPEVMENCEFEAGDPVAMSADYVQNQLRDPAHDFPFDHLLYGSGHNQMDLDMMTSVEMPDYFSNDEDM